ncbi:MAG: hypothetical protein CMG69_06205 [Candidatus Marinimicrobia bacterium]|nr:hypothetical protein [Candidatus Neomarinimicrobiota bacterium]|tara:strand:+ start:4433 stop:4936 length:504 start_codon:yes stop_codon:yes gene_type:complete
MAKKQLSFAEKAAKKKGKSDIKYVKYVNSLKSEKTKQWRFNERMIALEGGESLDAALKRIEEEKNILNIELPDPIETTVNSENETPTSVDESSPETDEVEPSIPEAGETSSDNDDLSHDKKNDDKDTNQEEETNRNDIADSGTIDSNDVEAESGLNSESQAEDSKEK